jgi:integrase
MLTDTAIRKTKAMGKRVRLYDAGGLYLEVVPAGGRWWRLKYRFAGKEKLISLGVYPDVKLADARVRCAEARKLLADGIDPSVHRRAQRTARTEKAANTFEVVAREWFEKISPGWAPSHATRVLSRLERDVFPYIGGRPIGELAPPDILRVLQRIENRNVLETAHRVRTDIGAVFRYAIVTGRADRDAAADLRGALKSTNPEHFAAVTDPGTLGELLRALWGYQDGTPVVVAALKLAPMLFVRPGELRSAKWADIDLDAGEWKFTASKTKTPHLVPLAPQAVAILRELQPLTGRGPYVFPSARSNQRPMSNNAVTAALRRMGIERAVTCGHGFRATARTLLDEVLGYRVDLIEAQLAHAVKDANGRAYNRTSFLPERRKMMQGWADYLDRLRASVKVIPFKQAEGA